MSNNDLIIKKLKILQNQKIWISGDVNVHSLYNNGNLKLIKGEVRDYRSLIDLTDVYLKHKREVFTGRPEKIYTNNWSTFKNLTEIYIWFDGTSVKVLISVFEGNSYDGSKEGLRWKGEFELNLKCVKLFEPYVEYAFDDKIDEQFAIEEAKRIKDKKSEIRNRLLEG